MRFPSSDVNIVHFFGPQLLKLAQESAYSMRTVFASNDRKCEQVSGNRTPVNGKPLTINPARKLRYVIVKRLHNRSGP